MKGRIAMLLDRLLPSRSRGQSEALRHAAKIHALSTLAVGSEARKTESRAHDFRVIADAAERRARERGIVSAIDDALEWPSLGGPRDDEADPC